jgi:hypothetical protein
MDIKKSRIKSFLGLAIFLLGTIICSFNIKEPIFFFIGLFFLLIGWFVFSHFHTQIAIFKLRKYTEEYISQVKK